MKHETIKIKVIEVIQPIGTMYIGKINGNKLCEMSVADIREIKNGDKYFGFQRTLDMARAKEIYSFIKTSDASFPNSIILNVDSKYVINHSSDEVEIIITEETFKVIDGQHRIAGFSLGKIENFELIVSIFIDLDDEEQVNIFKTINTKQKRVDPSLIYDLEDYSSVKTPRKIIRDIAWTFNTDNLSPWKNKIKMTGRKDDLSKEGLITLKAFCEPLLNFIYPDETDYYEIREILYNNTKSMGNKLEDIFQINKYEGKKYILWQLYVQEKEKAIYKILLNYFNAIKKIFKDEWGNPKALINKTTGYNALMMLFKDIFILGMKKGTLEEKFFEENIKKLEGYNFDEILMKLEKLSGTINSMNYGASGDKAAKELYLDLKKYLNNHI